MYTQLLKVVLNVSYMESYQELWRQSVKEKSGLVTTAGVTKKFCISLYYGIGIKEKDEQVHQ